MTLQEILDEGICVEFYKFNDRYILALYKFVGIEKKLKTQTKRMFYSNEWLYINEILDITYKEFKDYEKQEVTGEEE